MYRILIADDEGLMRESINKAIESNFGSQCDILTAKSGREVVELAESFRPDIIFMDIQMPGISGIQAIREIQQFDPSVFFIIITAYDRFAYAQEAINLGVKEYLMKPIKKKDIVDVCSRTMKKLDVDRQKRRDNLKVMEKLETVIPMIEAAFINNLLQESEVEKNKSYLQMLEINEENGYMMVLEFGDDYQDGRLTNAMGSNVRMNKQYNDLKGIIRTYFSCIPGPIMGNRIILYMPTNDLDLDYEKRVEIVTRARTMLFTLEDNLDMKFRVGIGEVKDIDNIYESYTDAVRCLQKSDKHVVHVEDLEASSSGPQDMTEIADLEQKFIQFCLKADADAALTILEDIHNSMRSFEDVSFGNKKMRGLELILRLELQAQEIGVLKNEIRSHEQYLIDVANIQTSDEIRRWMQDLTRRICSDISGARADSKNEVVEKAIAYIRSNYSKEISLDDVARQVDISPYYFSRLFKQDTGENFVEYLTKERIKRAKELLSNNSYSIKEVCIMCGYSDPNYFSRIFKKFEGVTPSEYRG